MNKDRRIDYVAVLRPPLAALLLVAGCTSIGEKPLPTDVVHDEAAAITIAKKACKVEDMKELRWRASLQDRTWVAEGWLKGERDFPFIQTAIKAEDGKASECTIIVVGR
jgi:hypothetical protein